jgi:putative transcriptional regulator
MQINQLAGQLLLATPSLQDPNFKDAVVLICHHDEDGCMGLIINQPRQISVLDVLTELGIQSKQAQCEAGSDIHQVFEGGPVDEFRGFVLHDGWHIYESTTQITPELHLTASRDVLESLALGEGPEHYLLLLGYAGWGAGQLESELVENDWLVAPASHQIIFQEPPEQRWNFGAHCMGIDRAKLSNQVGHA